MALFAKDVGLIPKYTILKILEEAVRDPVLQKEMENLFVAMATKDSSKKPKKYKDIPFFNGGIFHNVEAVELNFKELDLLYEASKQDWSKVRPSVFGSIFEASMDPDKRHDIGAHYTSELDIQKIVFPSIVRPIRAKIESAKSKKDLSIVLNDIRNFRVLDPACGSGNFLYVAFRELRRLEVEVMELIRDREKTQQMGLAMVSPKNFFGIDINSFGIELAKVALCIGRKISADEFKIQDNVLPFEDLEQNFLPVDALFLKWPEADAIIGNPPYLGSRKMRDSGMSEEYIKKIWALYPGKDFPKNADYCCYWFRKAHDQSAKYVGLVGSNSITQNESRKASIEYILEHGGDIQYAISTQEWSGDAAVHVSIVNWVKGTWTGKKILDGREVDSINSSLKDEFDISKAKKIFSNKNICFQGVVPVGKFEIDETTAKDWIKKDSKNAKVIKVFFSGNELAEYPDYKGKKYIIDFDCMSLEEASTFKLPFIHIKDHVKPQREKVRRKAYRENWWRFAENQNKMRRAIEKFQVFIAMPGHSKWFIPVVVPSTWLPYVNSSFAIASDDYYLLGVMTSKIHRDWVRAQSSTLKADTRYTNTTCFETFPFVWDLNSKVKTKVGDLMKKLDTYRLKVMAEKNCGITNLYNEFFNEPQSQLFILHGELDKLVCEEVYGWKYEPSKSYNAELFELNNRFSAITYGRPNELKLKEKSRVSSAPKKRAKVR